MVFVIALLGSGDSGAMLQLCAWAGMLPSYFVQTGSVQQALSQTFDGDHPCPMCKAVSALKEQEEKNQPAPNNDRSLKIKLPQWSIQLDNHHLTSAKQIRQLAFAAPFSQRFASLWADSVPSPPPQFM